MISVLVLDRNCMSSQMLADCLAKDPRFRLFPIASIPEALPLLHAREINVAVISADLADGPSLGAHFARTVHARYPQLGIVILLDQARSDSVVDVFRSGAKAVFSRTDPISELPRCIEKVSRGEIWAAKAETDFLLQALKSIPGPRIASLEGNMPLSKRELQVIQLAARGYTNKVIADKLALSEHTVKNYLFRSFEKLGVSSRVELLFFLTMEGKNSYDDSDPSLDSYFRIAEKGFAAAKLALDSASDEAWSSQPDAYLSSRLMQTQSEQLASRCRLFAEQIKKSLTAEQIGELEAKISENAHDASTEKTSLRKVGTHIGDAWSETKSA